MVYEIIEGDNHIPNIYKPLKDCESVFITDIAYLSGKRNSIYTTIKHDRNSLNISTRPQLRGISGSEILTGLIKNEAWSYEKESRLIVRISDTNYDKIAIKIPEEVFKDFRIYVAPWVGMDFKRDIRKTLISDEYGFNQNQFQDSEFEGWVNYRGLCNYCEHKRFKRKLLV